MRIVLGFGCGAVYQAIKHISENKPGKIAQKILYANPRN